MKEWKIPVRYEKDGFVIVEANTLDDALYEAENCSPSDIQDEEYVWDSMQIEIVDPEYIRKQYNNGQKDEESEETEARA